MSNEIALQDQPAIIGVVCDFCGNTKRGDEIYLLEGRQDGKTVVCDECENKLSIVHR